MQAKTALSNERGRSFPDVIANLVAALAGSAAQKQVLSYLLLGVCTTVALVHLPGLSARGLYLDDHRYVVENALTQNPSWGTVARFFREVGAPSTVPGYYQPLTMVSLMLDRHMSGRYDSVRAYHRTSLLLHVANTALLGALLYLLFAQSLVAAGVALLFGLHPMTVEQICWIAERKTVLATFFALLSLITYVRYTHSPKRRYYVGCVIAYVLALLSKPIVVPLPAMMLLMDYWPLNRLSRRAVMEKVPLFALGAVFAVITYVSQSRTTPVYLPGDYSPWRVPLILCHNIVFYLYKLLWPARLSGHHGFPETMSLANPVMVLGVAGTCVLVVALILSCRRTRAPLTGWLIFFVMIFPAMGIISVTPVIAANRYVYLPAVGLLVVLAALLKWLGTAATRRGTVVRHAALAFFLLLAAGAETVAARSYQRHWRDTQSLYSYMLAIEPNATVLNTGMGAELEQHGRTEEAIVYYRRALETSPDDKIARANLALSLQRLGGAHNAEAKKHYLKALELQPDLVPARLNLGSLVLSEGNVDRAIDHYCEAVKIAPDNVVAHYNLGKALAFAGLPEEGLRELRAALRVNPGHVLVMKDLAWFLATHPHEWIRDPNEALKLAQQANAITQGRDIAVLATLAAAYGCDQRYSKAAEIGEPAYEMALRVGNDELADQIAEHLRAYEMEFAYVEAPRVQLDRLVAKTKSQAEQAQTDPQDATENLELETK